MKKILVDRNETPVSVVERIIADSDTDIVLVIPKNSALKESVANFNLIRREAVGAQKNVSVESVDEDVLALAKAAKLESGHPLLRNDGRPQPLLDIRPRRKTAKTKTETIESQPEKKTQEPSLSKKKEKAKNGEGIKNQVTVSAVPITTPAITVPPPKLISSVPPREAGPRPVPVPESTSSEPKEQGRSEEKPTRRRFPKLKLVLWIGIPVVIFGATIWTVGTFFGHATITINFKETPWFYESNFLVDTATVKMVPEKALLPGELFTQQKNMTQLFVASDSKEVSQKAAGRVTIYNAYSSAPQTLVATTRFITSDGKIFRLTEQVVVPGAEIKDGKIIPASIEGSVVADKPGPDYNVGPLDRLEIPGFKGTARYGKFYGELREPTTGGFVGKKPVPNAKDIAAAKTKTADALTSSLSNAFLNNRPTGFRILDGASEIKIVKLTVNENTDVKGNFSVFGEATFRAIGFRESDMRSFLEASATKDNPNSIFEELDPDYANAKPDFEKGRLSFSLKVNAALRPAFSDTEFKNKVLGKGIDETRSFISALLELGNAKVSLWPFWLGSVPKDPARVEIVVN